MPTGLPPNLSTLLTTLSSHLTSLIIYFQIPSRPELLTAIQNATFDSLQALRSNYQLLLLTCRPLAILLTLVTHHLAIVARVVLRHTLYHLWVILKNVGRQGVYVGREVYAFQRSLSRFWVLVELGFVACGVVVYLLRRFIKRRRYVERLGVWYAETKRRVVRKYTAIVRKISETSVFLALLIPHLSFLLLAIGVKYAIPTPVRFIASRTYLSEAIALWIPAVKTILYVGRMRKGNVETTEEETPPKGATRKWKKPSVSLANDQRSLQSSAVPKKKNSVANRWLTAVDNKSSSSSSKTPPPSSSSPPLSSPPTNPPPNKTHPRDADDHASELLRYWVVYSLLYSLSHSFALLPIVGRLSHSRLAPSFEVLCEIKLAFFVWLRHMKAPPANPTTKRISATLSESPTKMIYERVAPLAIRLSSGGTVGTTAPPSSLSSVASKLTSLLDVLVFTRVISGDAKQFIISMASESRNLLPAAMTLGMPSLFTSYGCIYASALVPACNSSNVLSHLGLKKGALWGSEERASWVKERTRWLKYYVIGCGVSLVLKSQESALRWIPFSTHATLLIWLWLNLPSESYGGVGMIWRMGERELVGFGLLEGDLELKDTITMRVWRRIEKRLPSAIEDAGGSNGSGSEDGKGQDDVGDDGKSQSDGGNETQNDKKDENFKNDEKVNELKINLKNDSKNDEKEGANSNCDDVPDKKSKPDTTTTTTTTTHKRNASSKIKFDPKNDTLKTTTLTDAVNNSKKEKSHTQRQSSSKKDQEQHKQDDEDCQNFDNSSTKKNTPAVLKEISNNTTTSSSLSTNDTNIRKTNNNTQEQPNVQNNSSNAIDDDDDNNNDIVVISSIDEDQQKSSLGDDVTASANDSPNNNDIATVVDEGTVVQNTSED